MKIYIYIYKFGFLLQFLENYSSTAVKNGHIGLVSPKVGSLLFNILIGNICI